MPAHGEALHLAEHAAFAKAQGVACEFLSPAQAAEKYPIMRTDDLLGALWLPDDAKVNPADVTQALAKGAPMGGARIIEQTRVTAIQQKDGVATGVSTCGAGPVRTASTARSATAPPASG